MYPFERYELIKNTIKDEDFISIKKLLKIIGCSLTTLRRDITYLEQNGIIKKSRGGIQYIEKNDFQFLYDRRAADNRDEKKAIGLACQNFIKNGDVIFLSPGTTTLQVAKHIKKNITVITNGIDIVNELRYKTNVNVIMLGGKVDYSSNIIIISTLNKVLEEINITKTIMGAGGITKEKGITAYELFEVDFYREMIKNAAQKIIVADHSKFGRNVLTCIARLDEINTIITDDKILANELDILKSMNITYVLSKVK